MLTIQLEKNRAELDYLDSVLQMITLSEGDRDLQEIRQELMGRKYKTIVDMETSDIGESSVKYGASLEVGGTRVPFMTEQRIEHRRKNGERLADILNSMKVLY